MNTRARFLPLACPRCSQDLTGRSADRVAFCTPCSRAYRCDGEELVEFPVAHVTARPTGGGLLLHLPFWLRGGAVMPAFLGARPLTLARVAAARLDAWPAARGLGDALPLGARLAPEALAETARLAKIASPSTRTPLALLSVPALADGERFRLPGWDGELFLGDVEEAAELRRLAAE